MNETMRSDTGNILRVCLYSVQLENFIQENVRSGMEEIKRTAVHSQTAAMLEMGTNLLSKSAEQTRKLTDVETQVSEITCLSPIKTNNCEDCVQQCHS